FVEALAREDLAAAVGQVGDFNVAVARIRQREAAHVVHLVSFGASDESLCSHGLPLEEILVPPSKTRLRPPPDIPACPKSERRDGLGMAKFGLSQPLAPRPVVCSARW